MRAEAERLRLAGREMDAAVMERLACATEKVNAPSEARRRAWRLMKFGQYEAAAAAAREAIALAERIGDKRECAESMRYLAKSLSGLGHQNQSIAVAQEAVLIAKKTKDSFVIAWALDELFWQFRTANQHDDAVTTYLQLLAIPDIFSNSELPKPSTHLSSAAYRATRCRRWRELQSAIITHFHQLSMLPSPFAANVAAAILAIASEEGRPAAFAAIAEFIDSIAIVSTGESDNVFVKMFRDVINELAQWLNDGDLLHDIAERMRERLPDETQTLQQLLEATARYTKSDDGARALERVDPDIALAILRTHSKPTKHKHYDLPFTHLG